MPNAMVKSSSGSNLCRMARYIRKNATPIMARLPHPIWVKKPATPVDSANLSRLSDTKSEPAVNRFHIRLLDDD